MIVEMLSYEPIWLAITAIQIALLLTQNHLLGIIRHARRGRRLPQSFAKQQRLLYAVIIFFLVYPSALTPSLLLALPALWLYLRETHHEASARVNRRVETAILTATRAVEKTQDVLSQARHYEREAFRIASIASQQQRETQTVKAGDFYDTTALAWGILDGIATTVSDLAMTANQIEQTALEAQEEAQKIADEKQAATATDTEAGAEADSSPGTPGPAHDDADSDSDSDTSTDTAVLQAHGFYEQALLASEAARDAGRKAVDLRLQVKNFETAAKRNREAREQAAAYAAHTVKMLNEIVLDRGMVQQAAEEVVSVAAYIRGKCAAESAGLAAEGNLAQALVWAETAEEAVGKVEEAGQKMKGLLEGLREKVVGLIQVEA
ncbi:hypothetical protein FE257_011402 [Aspergillus nanangensis]|uniref:Uncharacterized protein n=1 Tax=Aspergillus nanangensis TaxID=2582783 RepID=A0AAD4GRF7_ASPNN|nr:hypothetical protein FE257_011402 [Aspergillus nanangensis]